MEFFIELEHDDNFKDRYNFVEYLHYRGGKFSNEHLLEDTTELVILKHILILGLTEVITVSRSFEMIAKDPLVHQDQDINGVARLVGHAQVVP